MEATFHRNNCCLQEVEEFGGLEEAKRFLNYLFISFNLLVVGLEVVSYFEKKDAFPNNLSHFLYVSSSSIALHSFELAE